MRHDGVDVKLDVWDLKDGQDKYAYMEQCVTNPQIDKVLILSDQVYAEKADNRRGGVGDETTIISAEVYGNVEQQKFIPVVMQRDEEGKEFLPTYLKSRIFRDLSGRNYEEEYQQLLRTIYDEPIHRKPELGDVPLWLTELRPDGLYPLKDAVKKLGAANIGKRKRMAAHDFLDSYIEAIEPFYGKSLDKEQYLKSFKEMKEFRDVFLDYLKASSDLDHFGSFIADEFERLYNALYNAYTYNPNAIQCGEQEFDLFKLHVWELFVCTITYMLHFERYNDIYEILVHTYFLRISGLGDEKRPFSYARFRFHSEMLEERIKPTMEGVLAQKYTLTGHYVYTEREYLPIYSGRAMANADLFLYQVYNGLDLGSLTQWSRWFPTLYIYADEYDSMWKKLKSKRFCEKILPIFGAQTIDELKKRIEKCTPDRNYRYSGVWPEMASAILNWVKLDEIAILP